MAVPRTLNPINGKLVKAIETVSEITESATRLAVYISARETGFTEKQAARLSRSATVDFNKGGGDSNWINALWAFSKANINGNIRMLRVLRKSKWARRAAGGIILAGMMMTLWNMGVSGEDDEYKKK